MRYCVVILIITLLMTASPVMAEDVILGTVVSADEQSGMLIVRPIGKDEKDIENITVNMDKSFDSDHIRVGIVVRIWGSYINNETKIFRGTKISSERFRFNDPTGVRTRLRMGTDLMRNEK